MTWRKQFAGLVLVLVLAPATFAQWFPPSVAPATKSFIAMDWIAHQRVHYESVAAAAGDWIEVRISCGIAHCAQPAYFDHQVEVKIPKLVPAWWIRDPRTGEAFGSEVFGMVAPRAGRVKLKITTLYGGIEYRGTITVSAAPGPE